MSKKCFCFSVLLLSLLTSSLASAAFINQSDGDLNWNLDEATGLQWLDLTHTSGLSFNQMRWQFDGWTLASESQWRDMYSRYFDGDLSDGAISGESSAYLYAQDAGVESISKSGVGAYQLYSAYRDYFGLSLYQYERIGSGFDINRYRESFFSFGLYGNDIDAGFDITANIRLGGISAAIVRNMAVYTTTVENHVDSTANFGRFSQTLRPDENPEHGWYLVRQVAAVNQVPVPATLMLMIYALFVLAGVQRRSA